MHSVPKEHFLQQRYAYIQSYYELNQSEDDEDSPEWKLQNRIKTTTCLLIYCLNIGIDPPHSLPFRSKIQSWINPFSLPPQRALQTIGMRMQKQYERWSRARFIQCLDKTDEEIRQLCTRLKKTGKGERVLLHYNGHGVPKPTLNGEIWAFNESYTQYLPLSIYDIQAWLGLPVIYILDIPHAGRIVDALSTLSGQVDKENDEEHIEKSVNHITESLPIIALGPCSAEEQLPINPAFPADIFSSCLTTPIRLAIRFFRVQSLFTVALSSACGKPFDSEKDSCVLQNIQRIEALSEDCTIEKLLCSGRPNDRKSIWGQLNWIFTAVTDTIAWSLLPNDLFQRLFREDPLVASLFRNYLLAERVMNSLNCSSVSIPKLPETHFAPMWESWDLVLENAIETIGNGQTYQSTFFQEHLTAFSVWLELGDLYISKGETPPQLPIVLQVLLCQQHRVRALELLARFVDKGNRAIHLALSVGIFPYILKLLQSTCSELSVSLMFVWAKIVSYDSKCVSDLLKDAQFTYFLSALSESTCALKLFLSAYVMCTLLHTDGLSHAASLQLLEGCISHVSRTQMERILTHPHPLVKRWGLLYIAAVTSRVYTYLSMTESAPENLAEYLTESVQRYLDLVYTALSDVSPEVRSACINALYQYTRIVSLPVRRSELDLLRIGKRIAACVMDASVIVRFEVLISVSLILVHHRYLFTQYLSYHKMVSPSSFAGRYTNSASPLCSSGSKEDLSMYFTNSGKSFEDSDGSEKKTTEPRVELEKLSKFLWTVLRSFRRDPFTKISDRARKIVEYLILSAGKDTEDSQWIFQQSSEVFEWSRGKVNAPILTRQWNWNSCANNCPCTALTTDLIENNASIRSNNIWALECDDEDTDRSRVLRNIKTRDRSRIELAECVDFDAFDDQIGIFQTNFNETARLLFHPFESLLVACNQTNKLSLWDYASGELLNNFSNQNPLGTRISDLAYLNDLHVSLLSTASDDGVVRVWKNTHTASPELRTAFVAVPGMKKGNPGLVMNWERRRQRMSCCGNSNVVRIWDLEREQCVADVTMRERKESFESLRMCVSGEESGQNCVRRRSLLTCIAARTGPEELIAGCTDGSVLFTDLRERKIVNSFQCSSAIVGVHIRGDKCITACSKGEIRIHDRRMSRSVLEEVTAMNVHKNFPLTTFDVHCSAPVMASGSSKQFVKVMRVDEACSLVNRIRYHDGFLGQRIGAVNCLAFHENEMLLAVGGRDSYISVYTTNQLGRSL